MRKVLGVLMVLSMAACGGESDPDNTGFSRDRPAALGQGLTFDFLTGYRATLRPERIVRGQDALQMILAENRFNRLPEPGFEYILVYIHCTLIEAPPGESWNFDFVDFDAVSGSGVVYDFRSVIEPAPELGTEIFPGASTEGWLSFHIRADDPRPLLRFAWDTPDGTQAWWKLYQ